MRNSYRSCDFNNIVIINIDDDLNVSIVASRHRNYDINITVPAASTQKNPRAPPENATDMINLIEGFIPFTNQFKYLGIWMVPSLSDEFDIDKRIAATTGAMHSLKGYFRNQSVSVRAKNCFSLYPSEHSTLGSRILGVD
mmetsp:Transcript_65265/g.77261  ORF Transcript_65265/g.77261 Transcript_65265/m.77261 type:complete len:140 (-) Transcript_65265:326-745(-)